MIGATNLNATCRPYGALFGRGTRSGACAPGYKLSPLAGAGPGRLILIPELHYFGVTQKTAPLAVREKLRSDHDAQVELLSVLSEHADGRMVLATCERFEIYTSAHRHNAHATADLVASVFGLSRGDVSRHATALTGSEAAEHLLRVAAGLESRIVGERQILGQVRNSHQTAQTQEALDGQLSLLARTAIRAGKRVRQETALDSGRSIVTVAMDWIRHCGECIKDKSIAVVGSGRLAALVACEVMRRHPRALIVTGRNASRAADLAARHSAQFAPMDALAETLAQCDMAFACTSSPTYIIDDRLLHVSRKLPLLLVDLCVPRNVNTAVGALPRVTLAHLDEMVTQDLAGAPSTCAPQQEAIEQAERLVAEELEGFLQWRRQRRAAPSIADLVKHAAGNGLCKQDLHEQIMRLKAGVAT